jgi:hypothetical protein
MYPWLNVSSVLFWDVCRCSACFVGVFFITRNRKRPKSFEPYVTMDMAKGLQKLFATYTSVENVGIYMNGCVCVRVRVRERARKVTSLTFEVNLIIKVFNLKLISSPAVFSYENESGLAFIHCCFFYLARCADYPRPGPGDPARLQWLLLLWSSRKQWRGGSRHSTCSPQARDAGGALTTNHQVV